jgi:hypothetical protein
VGSQRQYASLKSEAGQLQVLDQVPPLAGLHEHTIWIASLELVQHANANAKQMKMAKCPPEIGW